MLFAGADQDYIPFGSIASVTSSMRKRRTPLGMKGTPGSWCRDAITSPLRCGSAVAHCIRSLVSYCENTPDKALRYICIPYCGCDK
ncbi:hypothetical protein M8818_000526 [Zalaria obscura]|uniref:Uncharacterized protein n=1 Tax=Zalaria obscura TaxID=2024903 RepID=A0ACC3SNL1_9PEZI